MKQSRKFVTIASIIGLIVTAWGVLAIYIIQQQLITTHGSAARVFESQSFASEKEQIATYVTAALKIHADYKSGSITRSEEKKRALALTVPAVLRDRHLQWVIAIDAGRDGAIDDMMQEYQTLSLVH